MADSRAPSLRRPVCVCVCVCVRLSAPASLIPRALAIARQSHVLTSRLLRVSAAASSFSGQFSFVLALSGLRDSLQGMLGACETKPLQLSSSFGPPPLQPSCALQHFLARGSSRSHRDLTKGRRRPSVRTKFPRSGRDGQRQRCLRGRGEGCSSRGLTGGMSWQPPPCTAPACAVASPSSSVQRFHSVFAPFSPKNAHSQNLTQNLSLSLGFRAAALGSPGGGSRYFYLGLRLPPSPSLIPPGRAGAVLAQVKE